MVKGRSHAVTIRSNTFGEMSGTTVFLTDDLFSSLQEQKSRDGTPILKLLETGRALKGLKHLIESIMRANKHARIVFTSASSQKLGTEYRINWDDYRRASQAQFFPLYRETGLKGAEVFLNRHFPRDFPREPGRLSESEMRKVSREFPIVVGALAEIPKNQLMLLKETAKTLPVVKSESTAMRIAVQALQQRSSLAFYEQRLAELKLRLSADYAETSGDRAFFGANRPACRSKVGHLNGTN